MPNIGIMWVTIPLAETKIAPGLSFGCMLKGLPDPQLNSPSRNYQEFCLKLQENSVKKTRVVAEQDEQSHWLIKEKSCAEELHGALIPF